MREPGLQIRIERAERRRHESRRRNQQPSRWCARARHRGGGHAPSVIGFGDRSEIQNILAALEQLAAETTDTALRPLTGFVCRDDSALKGCFDFLNAREVLLIMEAPRCI